MKKKANAFLLALYLFISSSLISCANKQPGEEIEVTSISEPTISTTFLSEKEPTIIESEPINIDQDINDEKNIEDEKKTKHVVLTTDEIALQVINGKWGNGIDRKNALTSAGYDYAKVTKRVNEILAGSPYTIPDRNTYNYNFGYVSENVSVYDENGNVEGTLTKYQKFVITDKKINDMVFVHFKNQTFYLKESDIKKLADSYLEIDISDQKVYMYIDGELILDADVITGNPNKGTTPGTNLGITEIYAISYNVEYDSGKKSKVFITFNWDLEGFHDAPWRENWEFDDKERYLTHGSNGCANMKEEDVMVIEDNCYLGMPVLSHR